MLHAPQGTLELQAQLDEEIRKEIKQNANTIRDKTPLQKLKMLMNLMNDFSFDPTKGDPEIKEKMLGYFKQNVHSEIQTYE